MLNPEMTRLAFMYGLLFCWSPLRHSPRDETRTVSIAA
jgi:hypothetical protein